MRYFNTQTELFLGKEATNKPPERTYGEAVAIEVYICSFLGISARKTGAYVCMSGFEY